MHDSPTGNPQTDARIADAIARIKEFDRLGDVNQRDEQIMEIYDLPAPSDYIKAALKKAGLPTWRRPAVG
jgi:hypothetical protein